MNFRYFSLILSFFVLTSCASNQPQTTGLERSEQVRNSMERVHENTETLSSNLNNVETSLSALTRRAQPDLKETFKEFANHVNALESTLEKLENNTELLDKRTNDYFKNWETKSTNYQNPELMEVSSERREILKDTYEEVDEFYLELRRQIQPYLTNVKEIRDYLGNDLSSAGIESVKSLSDEVIRQTDDILDIVDDLKDSLEDAMAEMSR